MARRRTAVKLLESCRVALPPDSVSESSLRLTFFDVMWLQYAPVQRLFFYKLPPAAATTIHFQNTLLPHLKLSLSHALHLFYPLCGMLNHHHILSKPGDSVSLTVAESDSDFLHLCGDHPRDAADLHPLLPHLPPIGALPVPVLALQVTHFPDTGICIGIAVHHAAADGWSSTHFMKSWASIFRSGDPSCVTSLPVYNRTETAKLDWITRNHLREMEKVRERTVEAQARKPLLRATFELRRHHVEGLRQTVLASRRPAHVSSFTLTCAYVWSTLVKARALDNEQEDDGDGNKTAHFVCAVDCRSRLDPPLPVTYFGNCIGECFAEANQMDLRGEDGIVFAAEAIGKAIRGLEAEGPLQGAESWIRRAVELATSKGLLSVAGSPKFRIYETDFGWGTAEKVEVVSIEGTGAMSLAESRTESEGGGRGALEVGLALPPRLLTTFASLFEEGLRAISPSP